MAEKLPLVYVDGGLSQLPPGDSVEGIALGTLTAGSGLVGGGNLSTGDKRLDLALAANASGVVFVGDSIGLDGADVVLAAQALLSGNAGLSSATAALSSGVAAQSAASSALITCNNALNAAVNFTGGNSVEFTAASAVASGYAVGLDDTGKVQSVRASGSFIYPTIGSRNNFIGIAQNTAASGTNLNVLLPDSIDYNQSGLTVGSFYYVNPTTSGFTTASGQPSTWSGAYNWAPVAKAVSSSGLLLLNPL
jgi:hypothetical protein